MLGVVPSSFMQYPIILIRRRHFFTLARVEQVNVLFCPALSTSLISQSFHLCVPFDCHLTKETAIFFPVLFFTFTSSLSLFKKWHGAQIGRMGGDPHVVLSFAKRSQLSGSHLSNSHASQLLCYIAHQLTGSPAPRSPGYQPPSPSPARRLPGSLTPWLPNSQLPSSHLPSPSLP